MTFDKQRARLRNRTVRGTVHPVVMLGAALALAAGCVSHRTGPAVDGDDLRSQNWWTYYQRAGARMQQGRFAEARADLKIALGVEPGARYGFDRDVWRARTYGVHFIDDYFPHRELGVCLYRLGDYPAAEKSLETSLRQTPSGRAKYYLNQVRARLVRQDAPPPNIKLDAPPPAAWAMTRRLQVAGSAQADALVREVCVGAWRMFIEVAEPMVMFSASVDLQPGANTIAVAAEDLRGARAATNLLVMADWQAPEIIVTNVQPAGAGWRIAGVCRDDFALASLVVDGQSQRILPADGGRQAEFTLVLAPGAASLVLAADRAGNQLRFIADPGLLAEIQATAGLLQDPRAALATDMAATAPRAAADAMRPYLNLSGTVGTAEVFDEEYALDGTAADGGGLAGITINGEELLPREFAGEAVQYRFERRLLLEPGTNRFVIAARDMAGNETRKALAIVRRAPAFLAAEHRLTLAMPAPEARQADPAGAETLRFQLKKEILQPPPRFRLLERAGGWDDILREQEISASVLADEVRATALRIGRLFPAELLLMVSLRPDSEGTAVCAQVVETGAGEILCSENVYCADAAADQAYQVAGLVMKIEQAFPLVEGKILAMDPEAATIDAGAQQGVRAGTQFVVAAPEPGQDRPQAGQLRSYRDQPVRLRVERVMPDRGVAAADPPAATKILQAGDFIYAR